jgi:serine/threonine protein kinase
MLLGSRQYGKPTDIWSVGCIIAELLFGQPIFQGISIFI